MSTERLEIAKQETIPKNPQITYNHTACIPIPKSLSPYKIRDLTESHLTRLLSHYSKTRILNSSYNNVKLMLPPQPKNPIHKSQQDLQSNHDLHQKQKELFQDIPNQEISPSNIKHNLYQSRYKVEQTKGYKKPKTPFKFDKYIYGKVEESIYDSQSSLLSRMDMDRYDYEKNKQDILDLGERLKEKGVFVDEDVLERALLRPKETRKEIKKIKFPNRFLLKGGKNPVSETSEMVKIPLLIIGGMNDEEEKNNSSLNLHGKRKSRKKGTMIGLIAEAIDIDENAANEDTRVSKINNWWTRTEFLHMKEIMAEKKKQLKQDQLKRSESDNNKKYLKNLGHIQQSTITEHYYHLELVKDEARKIPWAYIPQNNRRNSKVDENQLFKNVVLDQIRPVSVPKNMKSEHVVFGTLTSKYKPCEL